MTTALTCSSSIVEITFVNDTNNAVSVYETEDLDDFLIEVPPHTEKEIAVGKKYWNGQLVVRRNGVIVQSESLTWEQLSENGHSFEYVITDVDR